MRKLFGFLCVFLILLAGCGVRKNYSTAQKESNVVRIEIINIKKWYNHTPGNDYEFDVVCEIAEAYHATFLKELYDLPCSHYYGSPYDGIMEDAIRITYKDGSFELVTERSVYYETANGAWAYPSYDFEQEPFEGFVTSWKLQT